MKTLEPTGLAFLDAAPIRIVSSATFAATPTAVFAELADAAGWTSWFPLMHHAQWLGGATGGIDAEREVSLRVFGTYRERMIAWEPGVRYAFTVLGTTSPFMRQMAEDYRLTAVGGGTRLDWVMAATPTKVGSAGAPFLRRFGLGLFQRAGRRLAERLRVAGGAAAMA